MRYQFCLHGNRPPRNRPMNSCWDAVKESMDSRSTLGAIASDTEEIPLVRVPPVYPERARQRGIEGWVEVSFTISAAGAVKDPDVTGYSPSQIFNRAALRAIRKWKYNPKVVDGAAVERVGVTVRLRFEMPK